MKQPHGFTTKRLCCTGPTPVRRSCLRACSQVCYTSAPIRGNSAPSHTTRWIGGKHHRRRRQTAVTPRASWYRDIE